MGNVCSPSFSCDDTVSHCLDCTVRKAAYVTELRDNLEATERELKRLIEVRNDVKIRIIVAEQQQMKRLEQVQGWLARVQELETQVRKLMQEGPGEVEKLCIGGFFSKNYKSSYKFGKEVFEILRHVKSLKNEGDFKDVALPVPENPVDERPLPQTIVGLQSTFERVWRCFMDQQVGIIGLYGMGGVGKTTLLTKINNKFLDIPDNFDFVIWIVVSKDLQLEKIQEGIAKKIGLFNESWKSKSLQEKAHEIFKILSKKKFVLLLDDIWELVDLAQVGLPVPGRTSTSNKVVFTTREFDVCGQMGAHKHFKVECLGYEDAWKLFEDKVGRETLDSHSDILELAETVAKECGGLPLALITVGRAMATRKTPRDWEHAIEVLKGSAYKLSGMERWVYSRLKLSYDFLPSDANRFCLLYCSLFPEDYSIRMEDLIDCWISEGFLDEYDGIRARNEGHSVIRDLIHACLLEELSEHCVKMHDVVRDMALWIASTIDKEKERFLVLAGVGLTEAPSCGMWKEVTRMSLMENKIQNLLESPECHHLQTLFLNSNDLGMVNNSFFQSMASLRVLMLSYNKSLYILPLGISNLVSLQYLDLSMTGIRSLPIELKYMVNLKCLNLENTSQLARIPPHLISNLKMLRALRMFECGWSVGQELDSILFGGCEVLVEELLGLEHLEVLTITLHSFCALRRLLSSRRIKSIRIPSLCLSHCSDSMPRCVFHLASLRHLETLHLVDCYALEEFEIDYAREVENIRLTRGFQSLQKVYISYSKLRHLTWLILAPNLKHLWIYNCPNLEEIISIGKLGKVPAEVMENSIPFTRLDYIILVGLQNLKRIHPNALPFPHLKEMSVHECPELKKLPFDCSSGLDHKFIIKGHVHWWNELQWDDQATKYTLLPSFKPI